MQKTMVNQDEGGVRNVARSLAKGIRRYNWINPIILFVALYHFTAVVHDAIYHFEVIFSWETPVEIASGTEFAIAAMVSLIVGIVGGIIQVLGKDKWGKVKEYWKNNYWKDMLCFFVVFAVVLIVSYVLVEVHHGMWMDTLSEKITWVMLFVFPQTLYVFDVIPGALAYYLILFGSRK